MTLAQFRNMVIAGRKPAMGQTETSARKPGTSDLPPLATRWRTSQKATWINRSKRPQLRRSFIFFFSRHPGSPCPATHAPRAAFLSSLVMMS